jgi:hypothetical protein
LAFSLAPKEKMSLTHTLMVLAHPGVAAIFVVAA